MIRILADLYGASAVPAGAHRVAGVADYVGARRAVRVALDTQRDLTLYITDVVTTRWLSDLRRYPADQITWHDLRPGALFEQLFGALPSLPFSADLLATLELETITPPPPGQAIEPLAYILGQRLDALWAYADAPTDHIAQVVRWAAARLDWQPGPLLPLIDAQLHRWAKGDARFAALQAAQLPADARYILTRSALARYDAVWQRTQPWNAMPEIVLDGAEVLVVEALRPLHTRLAAYWSEQYARAGRVPHTIDLVLDQVSGLSTAEIEALAWMLEQHPARLTTTLLSRIERCFARLPEGRDWLVQLRGMVVPPTPALPEANWKDGRWLGWAVHEYMPYFGWIIRTNQSRDHQSACAEAFGDWVYERYPHWCNDDDAPLARRQHSALRDLLDRDQGVVVFWLVLDGMAWWHGEMMRRLCEQHSLYAQEHAPAIAALPSITHIAKRALVTGVSTTDIEQPTIRAAANAHFGRIGIPAHVTYRMREGLDVLRAGTSCCVIVLDNTIDETAHNRRVFTDTPGIRGHLEELAAALGQARSICAGQGRHLHVLIGSDHGGTLLPETASALPLPRSVKPIEEIWEDETPRTDAQKHSPRAATIEDIKNLAPQERARWYVLDRDQFQLERHYLAPRGYAYLKPRPGGWTHGGLTPEELVVPLLHLAPELPTIIAPQLIFEGSLRPNQATVLTVELINTNRFPLEQLRLTIGSVEHGRLESLDAAGSDWMDIDLPAAANNAAQVALEWRIDYYAFGVAHMYEGQSIVPVRRLSVDISDIDDMFDDL